MPFDVRHIAQHARRFAQQHTHRHIDHTLAIAAFDDQVGIVGNTADHRIRAALASCNPIKRGDVFRCNSECVALLRLVAPDLERAHATLFDRDVGKLDAGTAPGLIGKLRHRIRQTAGADIVNRQDGVTSPQRPAAIDDFLRSTLHFRIPALNRIEIELLGVGSSPQAGSRATAKADSHARPTQLDQQSTRWKIVLADLLVEDVADAARDHDRLVIAISTATDVLLVAAKIANQIWPPELVVERRRPDRTFDHDRKCIGDARRKPKVVFGACCTRDDVDIALPGVPHLGNTQVRHRESAQARLRLGTASSRPLITNLAAGPGGCTWKWRNRGRVIVSLDLEYRVRQLIALCIVDTDRTVRMFAERIETLRDAALEHR